MDFMECSVCTEPFDDKDHRPKVLPCGHTFCYSCIKTPGFGKVCPDDRKVIQVRTENLPDNFLILRHISGGQRRAPSGPAFWCKVCASQFTTDCANAGHTLSTVERLHEDKVEPQLKKLVRAASAGQRVAQHLKEVDAELHQQLQAFRDKVGSLESTAARLQAAVGDLRSLAAVLSEAESEAQGVQALENSAKLLEAKGSISVAFNFKGTKNELASWTAAVENGGYGHNLVRHLMLQMLSEKRLKHVPTRQVDSNAVSDVTEETDGSAMENSKALQQVPRLSGLDCAKFRDWSLASLLTLAPHLEELHLMNPRSDHMVAISKMTKLRKLCVDFTTRPLVVCPLPQQLEELEAYGISRDQLASAFSMPNLRRLSLHDYNDAVLLTGFNEGHCGLQWLLLDLKYTYEHMTSSLIKGSASTLEELKLTCTTTPGCGQSYFYPDVSKLFEGCAELPNLRRVVLMRTVRGRFRVEPGHDTRTCFQQVMAVTKKLTNDHNCKRAVTVHCSICDQK